MKTGRLLLYGIAGIIGGLLVENSGLRLKNDIRKAKNTFGKKLAKSIKDKH